jgi:hypothetical protein
MSRIVTELPVPAARLVGSAFKIQAIYRIRTRVRNPRRIVRRDMFCE